MAQVRFTQNLERHLSTPSVDVEARSVREALERTFDQHPRLRSYVVDDQGRLRKHVVVFVDGEMIEDRLGMSDALEPTSQLFVMQALSGG